MVGQRAEPYASLRDTAKRRNCIRRPGGKKRISARGAMSHEADRADYDKDLAALTALEAIFAVHAPKEASILVPACAREPKPAAVALGCGFVQV